MSETVARARMFGFHGDWVALERHHYEKHPEGDVVFYEVAEKLERERDEARRERDEARKALKAANRGAETNAKINQGLCARLTEAERERDNAREFSDQLISFINEAIEYKRRNP